MSLIVSGAGGQLGGRTAELLLERVEPTELVLVTRRPETLGAFAARGAQVRAGDFDDPATLAQAFAGGERLLLISTDRMEGRTEQHRRAIDAAREAGVEHVVYTSLPNPGPDNPAAPAVSHRETEEAIVASGMSWTFLRNALYAEFRVPDAQAAAATGEFRHDFGHGRTAFVSREDCAASAAAVLADAAAHRDAVYDITGPALLDADDLARIYGEVAGREVRAVALSEAEWIAHATAAGLPAPAAQLIATFGRAIRDGQLAQLSDAVQTLTGRAPVDVATVVTGAMAQAV